jgi:hypothetical protein
MRNRSLHQPGWGKEHPDTLISMKNLTLVLRNQDKDEEAEEMYPPLG